MPVSPADFALWARETNNKYPETAQEKLAAAPHAYAHAKNFGKAGSNAPGTRVGGSILYDQPVSVQNKAPNSLFNAPVTPDNRSAKVAGTLDPTLTGEQFKNEEGQEVAEHTRQHSLINTIGKTALAAGAVAAGVALARNPAAQQAIRTAGTSISENAQNIGSRVSDFLGGLGGGRNVDPDVIRNSGDVTPPTTAQRYQQDQIPVATQEVQVAKGAPTGSVAEATLPPTTESYDVKPVTESDVITSSQSFGPRVEYEGGALPLRSSRPSEAVQTAHAGTFTENLLNVARARKEETYQKEIPGLNPTLLALRSKEVGVSPQEAGLYQPSETGSTLSPTTHQYSLFEQTSDPWSGEQVSTQPQVDIGEQTAKLDPGAILRSSPLFQVSPAYEEQHPKGASGLYQTLTTRTGYGAPVRHEEVDYRPLGGKSLVRTGGAQPGKVTVEHPHTYDPHDQRDIGEFAVSGARDVTSFTNKAPQRFAGERDIEASLATQEAQGVFPTGQFSSLASGEQYEPAILHRLSSMIDPRVVTQGEQGARSTVAGYLGGKAAWMQKAEEQAELRRQAGLQESTQRLGALKQQERQATDKKAKTFLKQALGLYDVTQDPAVLESAAQQAMPLEVTLPGGETVPTQSFFKPFGAVGSGEGSNLTQAQLLENNLIGKQTTYGNTKAGILANLGVEPTAKLTASMFNSLPQSARKALTTAHTEMMDARSRLQSARDNEILFSVPENILEGTKTAPIISSTTGDVVGMTSVPEEKTLDPLEFYRMRASGGVGRSEVGGVGRRREALADLGHTSEGAVSDVTAVLYQDQNTGEVAHADDIDNLLVKIANKVVKPIRGSAVEPQRLMGKSDRSYKGISANVIDPASFDPTLREDLAKKYPERVTPEGLLYTKKATEEVPDAVPMHVREELSPAMRGLRSAPTSRAATSPEQAYARAMLHAAVWGGEPTRAPLSSNTEEVQAAPVRIVHEARPQQLSIPGAGLGSQLRSTPALEEALATERYMGSRPGTNLRSAMQKALAKASVHQPALF
jgi:hypothetical protein